MFSLIIDTSNITNWIAILLTIPSLVIAFIAMNTAIKAYKITHSHNKTSVKPFLHARYTRSTNKMKSRFYIENTGLGPLIFTKFVIKYDGETYKHVYQVLKKIHQKIIPGINDFSDLYIEGSRSYSLIRFSMKEGAEKNIFRCQVNKGFFKDDNNALSFFKQLMFEFESIEFKYAFEDIYGEIIDTGIIEYNKQFTDDESPN